MNSVEAKKARTTSEVSVMQVVLKAGVLYSALVFGAGFLLGPVRILWVVPRFGTRTAELMEIPIMLVVIIASARWIVRRLGVPSTTSSRLGMGCVALGLLLVAEFTLVLSLQGMSASEYFASRDPVSGTVYYAALAVFAVMPLFAGRARRLPRRTDNLAKHESRRSVSNRVSF